MKPRLRLLVLLLLLVSSVLLAVDAAIPKAKRKVPSKPKPRPKPQAKPAVRHPVKPAVKPKAKPAAKPHPAPKHPPVPHHPKPAVRPAVRPAAHPAVRPAARPAVHSAVRSAVHPAVRPAVHPAVRPAVHPAVPAPAELSNSFVIVSYQDLEPQMIRGRQQTPCEFAIARARSLGGKHFSIVNTAYWLGGPGQVNYWAYKDVRPDLPNGFGYDQANPDNIKRWKNGLQHCFRTAIKAGFSGVQILNHIDNGDTPSTWRNLIDFDPLAQYGGFSYKDVVVRPAADSIRTVTRPTTKVWFMVAGEMGRSVFKHPKSYMSLFTKYRGTLARGKVGSIVKIGLALHWDKVCGDCFYIPYSPTPQEYNASYTQAFQQQAGFITQNFNLGDIKRMFELCDVLGISHYAPMPINSIRASSFEMPFMTTAFELKHWGVDLRKLVMHSNKDFLFSEVGLGGANPDGRTLANDLNSLAQGVENGIWAVYNTAQDPWKRQDYRDYRRKWFYYLINFLRTGGSKNVKINAAFVWSVGSFDVAGVHPISTSAEGTYADPEITGWMMRLSRMTPVR